MSKKTHIKTFFQKLRFRYKISVLNENTLDEVWYIRLSRLRVFLLSFLLFVILFALNTFLLIKSPLKKFTPGYLDSEIQTELITKSIRLDSLLTEFQKQGEYINAVKSLMVGDIKIDTIVPIDSIVLKERERTFIEKSDAEKEFSENFESDEKYNLSILDAKKNQNLLVFFPPVNGIIVEKFQMQKHYGIDISSTPNESVASVLDGTVVLTEFTLEDGYVIQVQHTNNFISIYKNNSILLKKIGDNVKSGESIAIVGSCPKAKTGELHFELWREGIPLNPENYIVF